MWQHKIYLTHVRDLSMYILILFNILMIKLIHFIIKILDVCAKFNFYSLTKIIILHSHLVPF